MHCLISIDRLTLQARHGVLSQERKVGNTFEVSAKIDAKAQEAMETDRLEHTVNYAHVAELIKEEMQQPSRLLENVAWRICQRILKEYPDMVIGVSVEVAKLAPPIPAQLQSVAATCSWGTLEYSKLC